VILIGLICLGIAFCYCIAETCYERDWPRRTAPYLLAVLFLIVCASGFGQASRYDGTVYTVNQSAPLPGAMLPVLALSGATVQICSTWNSTACTGLLQTYQSATVSGPNQCPTSAQLYNALASACSSTADVSGGFGIWTLPGSYAYFVTTSYGTFGPYPFGVDAAGAYCPLAGCTFTGPLSGPSFTGNVIGNSSGNLEAAGEPTFDVRYYGATGNGTTNDCAAISNAVAAWNTAGHGNLFFPQGIYYVGASCHMTVTASGLMTGVGSCGAAGAQGTGIPASSCGSVISSADTTGILFTVTSQNLVYRDLGFINTATVTAGAAIYTDGANTQQIVSCDHSSFSFFYDSLKQFVGSFWNVNACYFTGGAHTDMWIQNIPNQDSGDWAITGSAFGCGGSALACLYMTGTGGGKITGNKIIGIGTADAFRLDCTGVSCTGELTVVGNDIYTNVGTGIPVDVVNGNGYNSGTVDGNTITTGNSGISPVTVNSVGGWYIGGGVIASTDTDIAMVSVGGTSGGVIIGPFSQNIANIAPDILSCTGCFDFNSLSTGTFAPAAANGGYFGGQATDDLVIVPNTSGALILKDTSGNGIGLLQATQDSLSTDNYLVPFQLSDTVPSLSTGQWIGAPLVSSTREPGIYSTKALITLTDWWTHALHFEGLSPTTFYSAAGTPLPACSATTLGKLWVTDATVATSGTTYASGGTYTIGVECIFNSVGSTYTWIIN
jgi:hypothetical protein